MAVAGRGARGNITGTVRRFLLATVLLFSGLFFSDAFADVFAETPAASAPELSNSAALPAGAAFRDAAGAPEQDYVCDAPATAVQSTGAPREEQQVTRAGGGKTQKNSQNNLQRDKGKSPFQSGRVVVRPRTSSTFAQLLFEARDRCPDRQNFNRDVEKKE